MAKVQVRGQITIPADIRRACGIEKGDTILLRITGEDTFEAQVLPGFKPNHLKHYSVPGTSPDLAAVREKMGDELAKEALER